MTEGFTGGYDGYRDDGYFVDSYEAEAQNPVELVEGYLLGGESDGRPVMGYLLTTMLKLPPEFGDQPLRKGGQVVVVDGVALRITDYLQVAGPAARDGILQTLLIDPATPEYEAAQKGMRQLIEHYSGIPLPAED